MSLSSSRATSMFFVGLAVVANAATASAQSVRPVAPEVYDRGNNQGVRERPQPEYQPVGIGVGAFRLYPRLGVAFETNDNLYATPAAEVDDVARILTADARLESDWSRHALAFEANVEDTSYSDATSDDATTWGVGAEGRLDILRTTQLSGMVGYASNIEPRGNFDTIDLFEPIHYDELRGRARLTHQFNRLRATGQVDYWDRDYEDGLRPDGIDPGTDPDVFDQDFRDHTATELTGRLDYALSPDTALFASLSQRWNDYDLETFGDRDFDRTRALVGAAFDLTNLIRGEVGVGYSWARFADPANSDFDGLSLRGAVDWFVTRLTTVNFAANRDVVDSGDPDANSIKRTDVGVRVDHELYRNVIIWGRVGWAEDAYEGIDRTNTRTSYAAGASWLVNRWASVNARYIHTEQETSGSDPFRDYTQNRFLLGVTLRR